MARNIYARVQNGHLNDYAELELLAEIAAHEGKDVQIRIERKRKKRSLNQNNYYWGVVIPAVRGILEEYGNDVDDEETHAFLKEHIGKLTNSVVGGKGRRLAIVKSSAKLSTQEFETYILKITAWAATENVIIPSPNEGL